MNYFQSSHHGTLFSVLPSGQGIRIQLDMGYSHQAVRDAELQFIFEHWEEFKASTELQDMLKKVANGEMPHAHTVLVTLVSH